MALVRIALGALAGEQVSGRVRVRARRLPLAWFHCISAELPLQS